MKRFDALKSLPSQVGSTVEPTANPHSGDARQYPTCASELYPELFVDIQEEIANVIEDPTEGAGIALDGTDRKQLAKAIQAIIDAKSGGAPVSDPASLASGNVSVAWTNLAIGSPPAGAKGIQIRCWSKDNANGGEHSIEIRDSQNNTFEVCRNANSNPLGNPGSADSGIAFFDITGATQFQYRVLLIAGNDATLSWKIDRFGWI